MTVFTNASDWFGNAATHPKSASQPQDKMGKAKLACQSKDAALLRGALAWMAKQLAAPEGRAHDKLESAILACQRRDAAVVRRVTLGG